MMTMMIDKARMLALASALAMAAGTPLAAKEPATVAAAAPSAPASSTAPAAAHERLLPLEGGVNFRDLGGYIAADGRTVRWGRLFRSGSMQNLTQKDFAYLAARGLGTVIDLRSTAERTREPVAWPAASQPVVLARDYSMDIGALGALLTNPGLTAPEVRTNIAKSYGGVPEDFAPQYRMMFGELLAEDKPLAFNCSAGKDRTGVGAAILLSVLGVPRETVIEDYLLSNQYFRPSLVAKDNPAMASIAHLPPEALKALMGVDRAYIEAAFATMDAYPGGIDGYYREKLGLDAEKIVRLRDRLLVPAAR